jgi:hypothetical protein
MNNNALDKHPLLRKLSSQFNEDLSERESLKIDEDEQSLFDDDCQLENNSEIL